MRHPRRLLLGALAALVLPALALGALALDADGEPPGRDWKNAVVQFDRDGRAATVVVVYDAGEQKARRLEIEQQRKPGFGLTIGLVLAPLDGDTLFDADMDIRCVKARVRGLRAPRFAGVHIEDQYEDNAEGGGAPDAGFILPPLRRCRTVDATVIRR
jgi:hypothetical protein